MGFINFSSENVGKGCEFDDISAEEFRNSIDNGVLECNDVLDITLGRVSFTLDLKALDWFCVGGFDKSNEGDARLAVTLFFKDGKSLQFCTYDSISSRSFVCTGGYTSVKSDDGVLYYINTEKVVSCVVC